MHWAGEHKHGRARVIDDYAGNSVQQLALAGSEILWALNHNSDLERESGTHSSRSAEDGKAAQLQARGQKQQTLLSMRNSPPTGTLGMFLKWQARARTYPVNDGALPTALLPNHHKPGRWGTGLGPLA
jgi:hypothetical protein